MQVNSGAQELGNVSAVSTLVTTAFIPCGSTVRIYGQSSGPLAFTCTAVPLAQRLPVRLESQTKMCHIKL